MKNGNYLSYEFFENIDHESALAKFLNKVFHQLHLIRMISAPMIFNESEKVSTKIKGYDSEKMMHFYQTCLFEVYAHSLVRKLEEWRCSIDEYLNQFNGSWEYYARSKRLECIDTYGGEDNDYNEDGSVNTDISVDEIVRYSIILDLIPEDWKDIVLNKNYEDLNFICLQINVNGSFSLREMLNAMGADNLKSYRVSEEGQMIENSEDDEILHKVQERNKSEDVSIQLCSIVMIVTNIIQELKDLPKSEDNKFYFANLLVRIQHIFDMDILGDITNLQAKLINQTKL